MRDRLLTQIEAVRPLDEAASQAAQERLDQLTKPPGSLAVLERLVVQLAGITGNPRPRFPRKTIFVLAADHGVAEDGVSAYPQAVTAQMVTNFLTGGAAINVLARRAGARIVVADLGIAADIPPHPALVNYKVALGTENMARGPAMRREQALQAIEAGIDMVDEEIKHGVDLVATGDMGIANTTASAAITAVFTGLPIAALTGRGTGVDDEGLQRKNQAIHQALEVNRPDPEDPIGVLAGVGGFEIAGLVGVMLAGAAHHLPVVIDGFVSGAAALVAAALCPELTPHLIAAHCSAEPGHHLALAELELTPLLDLGLRLGEGTGAAIALHLIDDATAILDEMATFDEAGVSQRED